MEHGRRDLLVTGLWTVLFLVAADVSLGWLFRMPADPTRPPSAPAQYFDFGTSIESKLRRMVGEREETTAPLATAGWLEPFNAGNAPLVAGPGRRLLAVYGQSFAFQVVEPLARMDSTLVLRLRGGPAAPASHGYALWEADRARLHPDVAILGVLASSVRGVDAATASTWQFEAPPPYTYPRYRVGPAGRPVGERPLVRSLADLRAALAEPSLWRRWEAQLAREDAWYDPFLWRASWLDRSSLARLLRRAWAQREQRGRLARLHDRRGFREDSEAVRVLRSLAGSFVAGCRAEGTLPVVLLLEDAGYSDHLSRALGPELDRLGAVWLGTHEIADAGDPANRKGDGHFSPAVNERIAAALLARVRGGLEASATGATRAGGQGAASAAGSREAARKAPLRIVH